GLDRRLALEGNEGDGVIFCHRPDQRLHRITVAGMPEPGEGAPLELPGIGRTQMRPSEAERKFMRRIALKDECRSQGGLDSSRVDVAAIGGTARTADRIPVVEQRLGADFLHYSPHHRPALTQPMWNAPLRLGQCQNAAAKSPLNNP